MPSPRENVPAGIAYSVGAYLLWGVLPLFLVLLAPAGPYEIVAWRILFSLILCALLLFVIRGWKRILPVLRDGRVAGWLALGAVLLTVNWTVFVYASVTEQVIEAALGYFLNPILTVLLGVIFLRERLRPLQWAAVGVAAAAVILLFALHGSFPWIAIVLAVSFGTYGLVKNRVGGRVDAISGLAVETAFLIPLAALALVLIALPGSFLDPGDRGIAFGAEGPWHAFLMSLTGPATAIPLILFAAGARRMPLSYVGLIQFFAPILQFLIGTVLLHEPMPPERWVGFGVVWVAVVLVATDAIIQIVKSRRAARSLPG